ncbi:MAG: tetratricopeptide repeat protein [Myxococcales bacterium]|nr:tetratricopeptide repeat protein [Myxococcales bacterium]
MRWLVALLLITAGASVAAAQEDVAEETPASEDVPSASGDEEARALFTAGRVAFEQGHLERALEHFQRAYELSPQPGLLFNIGNTYDRLRRDEEAIEYLERYLAEVPDAANAGFVRSRIGVLRAQVDERRATEQAHDEERERLLEAANAPPDATASDVGIGLMIGGGVALLATIGTGAWWASATRSVNDCNPLMGCTDARARLSRQDAAMGLTVSLLVGGLLAAGGGLVLFLVSPRSNGDAAADDETADDTEVACGLAGAGAFCAGRF